MNIHAKWMGAGLVVGSLLGGGGCYWFTYAPPTVMTKLVSGPSHVVVQKIIEYKNHVVAASTITCGSRTLTVTARSVRARAPVTSRRLFNAHRIVLHISSYARFISFRQHLAALIGYGATVPMGGVPQAGLALGLNDRFARVGPVRFEGRVQSVGVGVLVMVDARVNL